MKADRRDKSHDALTGNVDSSGTRCSCAFLAFSCCYTLLVCPSERRGNRVIRHSQLERDIFGIKRGNVWRACATNFDKRKMKYFAANYT